MASQEETSEERRLLKRLYERMTEARVVTFVEVGTDDWKPAQHHCHGNVDWWVANNPGCKSVRGWLVLDGSFFRFVRFLSHSVVETEEGELIDITPAPGVTRQYPFLRHMGDSSEYERFIDDGGVVGFTYIIGGL